MFVCKYMCVCVYIPNWNACSSFWLLWSTPLESHLLNKAMLSILYRCQFQILTLDSGRQEWFNWRSNRSPGTFPTSNNIRDYQVRQVTYIWHITGINITTTAKRVMYIYILSAPGNNQGNFIACCQVKMTPSHPTYIYIYMIIYTYMIMFLSK